MALSIVETLETYGRIEQDALAQAFAHRFKQEPYRGYAGGAVCLLNQIASGGNWRELSPRLFGTGSYENGSAMRAAPIGGPTLHLFGKAQCLWRICPKFIKNHPDIQSKNCLDVLWTASRALRQPQKPTVQREAFPPSEKKE